MTLWTAAQAACDAGSISAPEQPEGGLEPTSSVSVASVSPLVAGRAVRVRGTALTRITQLVVDGREVDFRALSPEEGEFIAPETRPCEVDGRMVPMKVNGAVIPPGRVQASRALHLEVGESRILSADDLRCLQLPGGEQWYALTATSTTRAAATDSVLRLRSYTALADTTRGAAPSAAAAPRFAGAAADLFPPDVRIPEPTTGASARSVARGARTSVEPFDRYATAEVGDTLRFVNWSDPNAVRATRKQDVPFYTAIVIARSPTYLVVLDSRSSQASRHASPEYRSLYQRGMELAEPVVLRAARAVIDPTAQIPGGAGGRIVVMLGDMSMMGLASAADFWPTLQWQSNMILVNLNASPSVHRTPSQIASTLAHEVAHQIDILARTEGRGGSSGGWYTEAVAETARDMAVRMSLGVERQAAPAALGESHLAPSLAQGPSPAAPLYSPWSSDGSAAYGSYVRGAQILRYAQQKLGQWGFAPTGPTLHQRLSARMPNVLYPTSEQVQRGWSIEAVAREVGMTPEQLLEESALAEVLDDLVDPRAVERYNLPQVEAWDHARGWPLGADGSTLTRDAARSLTLTVQGGSYNVVYIGGGGGEGLSLAAERASIAPHHRVRLTRLR